jgi:hypothetical protein
MTPATGQPATPDLSKARALGRLGAALLWLGIFVSLGLTLITTFAWGFSASALRSERKNNVPDDQLADLIARTDFLAGASLWVALGAVPLGLILIIAGLAIRGSANRALRRTSKRP